MKVCRSFAYEAWEPSQIWLWLTVDHVSHAGFGSSEFGCVFRSKQHQKIQVAPHIVAFVDMLLERG